MPEISTLQRVGQGGIRVLGVDGGELRPVQADMARIDYPYQPYIGPTVFTPSDTAQTVQAAGCLVTENITINPIPSNYGKITWNGQTLTVS